MEEKLVSIVLPTRNGARYLREALDTCLAQTYTNIELIVVNDGSTDETPDILGQYDDARMRIVRHQQGRGLPEALNTGFGETRGEYLTWTSDDNYYEPHAIERLVEFLESRPEVGLVYSDYWLIDETGQRVGEMIAPGADALLDYDCVGACFLYRRAVYDKVGDYNPLSRPAEDYEYWLRVARHFQIAPLNQHLYSYRHHGSSLTGRAGWFPAGRAGESAKLQLGWIDHASWRRRTASVDICEAFEAHRIGDSRRVRMCVAQGVSKDLSHLRNSGVLSILLDSVFGKGVSNALRMAAKTPFRS